MKSHSCTEISELLVLDLDDEIDEVGRGRMGRHLATCSRCRARHEQLHALDALFVSAPMVEPPTDFTVRVVESAFADRLRRNLRMGLLVLLIGTVLVGTLSLVGQIDLVLSTLALLLAPGFLSSGLPVYLAQVGEALRLTVEGMLFVSALTRELALGPFVFVSLLSGVATLLFLLVLRQTRPPVLARA